MNKKKPIESIATSVYAMHFFIPFFIVMFNKNAIQICRTDFEFIQKHNFVSNPQIKSHVLYLQTRFSGSTTKTAVIFNQSFNFLFHYKRCQQSQIIN